MLLKIKEINHYNFNSINKKTINKLSSSLPISPKLWRDICKKNSDIDFDFQFSWIIAKKKFVKPEHFWDLENKGIDMRAILRSYKFIDDLMSNEEFVEKLSKNDIEILLKNPHLGPGNKKSLSKLDKDKGTATTDVGMDEIMENYKKIMEDKYGKWGRYKPYGPYPEKPITINPYTDPPYTSSPFDDGNSTWTISTTGTSYGGSSTAMGPSYTCIGGGSGSGTSTSISWNDLFPGMMYLRQERVLT